MNTTRRQNNRLSNWVAFLSGATINMLVSIFWHKGVIEFALYFSCSIIAGGVWLLYKIIADRMKLKKN